MFHSSTPLVSRLSSDALVEIAGWLPSNALCALVLCGDKSLSDRLARHMRTVDHRHADIRNFAWPFYLRNWTSLKHLTIRPGQSDNINFGKNPNQAIALTRAALESLPRSLETLHLHDWSLSLDAIIRDLYNEDQRSSKSSSSMDVDATLPSLAWDNGMIVMLQRLYLPNLRNFSLVSKMTNATRSLTSQYLPIHMWMGRGAAHSPLTHLSLKRVTLSALYLPLCAILSALPRTLIDLNLDINNRDHALRYKNAFGTPPKGVEMVDVLPPHLTRLKLKLHSPSHMHPLCLSRLANLQYLYLGVSDDRDYATTRSANDQMSDARVLSHLSASVTELTLTGLWTSDVYAYLDSIPDDHRGLSQLTIKRPSIRNIYPDIWKCGPFDFLHMIASRATFSQLEALYVFPDAFFSNNFEHPMFPRLGVEVSPLYDDWGEDMSRRHNVCVGLASMPRLRTVSGFFMSSVFDAVWTEMAPILTSSDPMTLRHRKDCPIRLTNHWSWLIKQSIVNNALLPHLVAERVELSDAITHLLADAVESCAKGYNAGTLISPVDNALAPIYTLLQSVKHLTAPADRNTVYLLKNWPSCLESLTLTKTSNVLRIDTVLDWRNVPSLRGLRSLVIEPIVGVKNLNEWMHALPETLEGLKAKFKAFAFVTPPSKPILVNPHHILGYLPPRLQTLSLSNGFAIDKTTFDALPPSLHTVEWNEVIGILCDASDTSRWPRHIRSITLTTFKFARTPFTNEQCCDNVLDQVRRASPCLTYLSFQCNLCNDVAS